MGRVKLTLKEMQAIAREHRGKCLSQEYQDVFTKLLWKCKEGHRWEARPNNIRRGQWCLECSGSKKLTLKEMQMLARKRGGKCLSQEYINIYIKLLWECAEGHQWEAVPNNIKRGTWCPGCYSIRRANQRKLKALKKARGSHFSRSL